MWILRKLFGGFARIESCMILALLYSYSKRGHRLLDKCVIHLLLATGMLKPSQMGLIKRPTHRLQMREAKRLRRHVEAVVDD